MTEDDWSVPESAVLTAMRKLLKSDQTGIIATVVSVEGSAYRRPGAKMLIPSNGAGVGSITAGCLEDEVLRLADRVLAEGRPRVETFDLVGDDDIWGLGVGCNGIIDLLLEPVDDRFEPLLDAYEASEAIASITVLESDARDAEAWKWAYYRADDGGTMIDEAFPEWLCEALADPATQLTADGEADTVELDGPDGSVRVFIDGIAPPPTLMLVGTGHDVGPVVELGNKNDFQTVVVGFRGAQTDIGRFQEAGNVVSTSPADIRDAVNIDDNTYIVVMTHNFIDDRIAVDELLKSPSPYVGLMGPRERFGQMLDEFGAEGRTFSQADLDRVYTPIGLDLGGGTPYQIAHSIVGEILTVHNDRQPCHLKEREGSIHGRMDINPSA